MKILEAETSNCLFNEGGRNLLYPRILNLQFFNKIICYQNKNIPLSIAQLQYHGSKSPNFKLLIFHSHLSDFQNLKKQLTHNSAL